MGGVKGAAGVMGVGGREGGEKGECWERVVREEGRNGMTLVSEKAHGLPQTRQEGRVHENSNYKTEALRWRIGHVREFE